MAENKTKPTSADVGAFLDAVPDPKRRADAKDVAAMMERLGGEPPVLWGPSIVGFGQCHYKCAGGREGEALRPRPSRTWGNHSLSSPRRCGGARSRSGRSPWP